MAKTYKPRRYRKGGDKRRVMKKKTSSDYNYAKLQCVGMPYNMYTYLRYAGSTDIFSLPSGGGTPAQPNTYWTTPPAGSAVSFSMYYNAITPYNLIKQNSGGSGPLAAPVPDTLYIGGGSINGYVPSIVANGLYTWSGMTWWANWYKKMRISHVWVKIQILPATNVLATMNQSVLSVPSTNEPFDVTYLESKFIPSFNTPEDYASMDIDDLRATKGARTWTVNGQRTKPLVIKRKISIAKLLGVKDLSDQSFSECTINPTMSNGDLASVGTMANPSPLNCVFGYIRVYRRNEPQSLVTQDQRFSIQVDMTCKAHLFCLQRNNPRSVTGAPVNLQVWNPEDETAIPQGPPPA